MRGQLFSPPKDAVEAFKLEVSQSQWKKCIDNWIELMKKSKRENTLKINKNIFDD